MSSLLFAFCLAFAASALLTFPVRALVQRFGIVDQPNERSSHQVAIPRAGGLAIVLAIFAVAPWLIPLDRGVDLSGLCIAAVALVSFRDDVRSFSFLARLSTQAVAATVLVLALDLPVKALDLPGMEWGLPRGAGLGLSIVFIVAYCNFFNFMDGINGLAAGQGTLTGAALAALLWKGGAESAGRVAAAVAGAAGGFLPHNFPRARIFMGDVGSVTLGFILALLSQVAHVRAGVPWTALLLVHAVFLFDASFTLVKRAARGEAVWRPHRDHHYQLLIRGGWPHPRTSLTLWLLSLEACAAGLFYARSGPPMQWGVLLATALLLGGFAVAAHRVLSRSTPASSPRIPSKVQSTGDTTPV